MLWVYLLGIVTVLAIVVRRLLLKQKPLDDEVYSYRLAIDHVSSGVAWVDANGQLHSVNPALAEMLSTTQQELAQKHWLQMFPVEERPALEDKFSQMLLAGRASLEAPTRDSDGRETLRSVLIVAVHDHKMRFVGHHCIIERILEDQPGLRVSTAGFATLSN
jgi:PAS domain S-box-containing protein